MQVLLNGKPRELRDGLTVAELTRELDLPRMIVVELNGLILERERFGETVLRAEDSLEIVTMVGGG